MLTLTQTLWLTQCEVYDPQDRKCDLSTRPRFRVNNVTAICYPRSCTGGSLAVYHPEGDSDSHDQWWLVNVVIMIWPMWVFLLPKLLHWGLLCSLPSDNYWNYIIDVDANHDCNVVKIINMIHTEGGVYNVERAAALVLDTDSHFHHSRYLLAGKKTQNHQKQWHHKKLTWLPF